MTTKRSSQQPSTTPHRGENALRASQRKRAEAMQRRIITATIESLVEVGYAATTTVEVQRRLGISRGTLLHHFRSREELIVTVVHELFVELVKELEAKADVELADENRIEEGVRLLWSSFSWPLTTASLELWAAARVDPQLRKVLIPLERENWRHIHELCEHLFGPVHSKHPAFDDICAALLHGMRSAVATAPLRRDGGERLVRTWAWQTKLAFESDENPNA